MKERLRNTEFDGLKQSQSDVLLGPILGQAIGDDDGKLVQHQDNVPAAISLFIQIHIHKQFGIYVYGTSLEKKAEVVFSTCTRYGCVCVFKRFNAIYQNKSI